MSYPFELREHDGFLVLRDDLIEGGTKLRVAPGLLESADEWVFAGPAQGFAQLALAIACEQAGKSAVFFTAARKEPAPITRCAMAHGCRIVFVPHGRISVVQARAREYCSLTGARFAELGLRLPGMEEALQATAAELYPDGPPIPEAWVAAGSGCLATALARAWPGTMVNAVQVGKPPHLEAPNMRLWVAPERFEEDAKGPRPPFDSASNYDAKAWRFVVENGAPGALFWNVAGNPQLPPRSRRAAS